MYPQMFLPGCNMGISFWVFKFTIEIPDTINTSATRILNVKGSPKTSPPKKTPAIGMIKRKECIKTAPYFRSMVFQATKPKEAVARLWYKSATMTFVSKLSII